MNGAAAASVEDSVLIGYVLDALLDTVESDAAKVVEAYDWFPKEGLVLNNFIATRVITAYGKLDQPEAAHQLLHSMGKDADAKTFGALIAIYAKAGDVRKVEELIGRMRSFGLQVDERSRGSQVMAHAKGRTPDVARTRVLFDELRRDALKPHLSVCNALVAACVRPAETAHALHVLRCMIADGTAPNSVTLAGILQTCWNARDPDTALEAISLCVGSGLLDPRLGHEVEGMPDHLTLEPHRLVADRRDTWRTDYALEALGWAVAHHHLRHQSLSSTTRIEGRPRARDAAVAVRYLATEERAKSRA